PPRRGVAGPVGAEAHSQVLSAPTLERDCGAGELVVGSCREPLAECKGRAATGLVDRRAMLGHRLLERGEPSGVGIAGIGQQLVARAYRRLVARGVMRVARLERQHQPIEEAATVARAARE